MRSLYTSRGKCSKNKLASLKATLVWNRVTHRPTEATGVRVELPVQLKMQERFSFNALSSHWIWCSSTCKVGSLSPFKGLDFKQGVEWCGDTFFYTVGFEAQCWGVDTLFKAAHYCHITLTHCGAGSGVVARNGRTNSCCPAFNNKNCPAFNDKNLLSITAHNNAPNAYYNVGREDIVRNYYVLGQRADTTYGGV